LDAAAANGDWPAGYWEQLLWQSKAYADCGTELKIAQLLLQWPHQDGFDTIAVAASWWLDGHSKTLPDPLLWPLWDRIADATLIGSTASDNA
jgi:hypothetical protein